MEWRQDRKQFLRVEMRQEFDPGERADADGAAWIRIRALA
jgi:hypothetical protein